MIYENEYHDTTLSFVDYCTFSALPFSCHGRRYVEFTTKLQFAEKLVAPIDFMYFLCIVCLLKNIGLYILIYFDYEKKMTLHPCSYILTVLKLAMHNCSVPHIRWLMNDCLGMH